MPLSSSIRATRRTFLATASALGATGLGIAQGRSANADLVVGVIGTGGQGRGHLSTWSDLPNVRVAYVCDVDSERLAQARERAPTAEAVADLRRVLDDDQVDAVSIATPDHWHTPAALLALEAGKHVYVEKPCSHNVREGRMLVEAAKRHDRIVQHGTQSRSAEWIRWAMDVLRAGEIGDVVIAKAWNVQVRPPIGKQQPAEPPAELDYDAWLGPAPFVPFQANRHHYSWHWWYAFGTGDAGNDGVHELDIARWGLGVDQHPTVIGAAGGKYVYNDDQQFPDTMSVVLEYPAPIGDAAARQLHFEMRLWSRDAPYGLDNGNEFICSRGRLVLSKRGVCRWFDAEGKERIYESPVIAGAGLRPHFENFVNAVTRGEALNADMTTAHLSASLPHLANLGCRVDRALRFDPVAEEFVNDEAANRLLGREYRDHWGRPRA
ncbi:MAG: Gfo/Idh/MocA family oxidoreductase [Planctomycetales bacterium]|nr:Gfo/Idh/MocA family oxidoreductase [Planctomycetales bacterium]